MTNEIWLSPSGVEHMVPVIEDRGAIRAPITGPCATCGRCHNVNHARNVRVYDVAGKCVTERADWPYECIARDKHPDDVVYRCVTHRIWWHEAAP